MGARARPGVGMTARLTPPEHERSEAVMLAAQWLADESAPPAGVIPVLRAMFNLTPLEATEACAMARRFQVNRKAFG